MPPPRSPSDIGIPMLNNKSETRKSKKKNANAAGLLLKGLGSMFRFGKHRKSAPASPESGHHQSSGSDPVSSHSVAGNIIMPSSSNQHHYQQERRPSGPTSSIGRSSDVDRHHVLRRTLPPDERDRAELGRQMAIAVARQVKTILVFICFLSMNCLSSDNGSSGSNQAANDQNRFIVFC